MSDFTWAVDLLKEQGIAGIGLLVMAYALRVVFKLYTEAQEKRISEAVDNRTAVERNTSALMALTDVIKDRRG